MASWGIILLIQIQISNAPMKDEQRISFKYLYIIGLFISPEVTLLNMYYQNKQHFVMHKRI